MSDQLVTRRYWLTMAGWPIRAGLIGVGLWLAFLCFAFASYPAWDNLAVGWPAWALLGLPGLEAMANKGAIFAFVLLGETLAVFVTFCLLGAVAKRLLAERT